MNIDEFLEILGNCCYDNDPNAMVIGEDNGKCVLIDDYFDYFELEEELSKWSK